MSRWIASWRMPWATIPLAWAVYAFSPGDPAGLLPGPPWRLVGALLLTAVVLTTLARAATGASGPRGGWVLGLCAVAIGLRVALAQIIVPSGWSSTMWLPASQDLVSADRIGRHAMDGGVIDREAAVNERSPALHAFNDMRLASGGPNRAMHTAWRMEWRGALFSTQPQVVTMHGVGDGRVAVSLDGQAMFPGEALPVSVDIRLPAGWHRLSVAYEKPAGVVPSFEASVRDTAGTVLPIAPDEVHPDRLRWHAPARRALLGLDALMLLTGLGWASLAWAAWMWRMRAAGRAAWFRIAPGWIAPALLIIAGFAGQGIWQATQRPVTIFAEGDDMLMYAHSGRDIATHGPWMTDGERLGHGRAFFLYPLYPYLVAASHLLFDESLFGLLVIQFLLLGATVALMARIAAALFGQVTAWLTLATMVALAQVDFMRWYTTSVFSDNLYYPLVAATVFLTMRLAACAGLGGALLAGAMGGAATLTRPTMMLFLPVAAVWIALTPRGLFARSWRLASALSYSAAWIGVVCLATLRNWIVSGHPTFLVDSTFQVLLFTAPPGVSYQQYMPGTPGYPSSGDVVMGLARMAFDHPLGVAQVLWRKLVFTLGFTNVYGGYSLHPEFVAITAGYVAWWGLFRRQTPRRLLVHGFLASHLVAMVVAAPWTYGYKAMLPSVMFCVPFGAAAAAALASRVLRRDRVPAASLAERVA